jgi:V/A-type H+-transporting ATPase subunit A
MTTTGRVVRVNGPLVEATGLPGIAVAELLQLGPKRLPGEVVAIDGDRCTAQAYEYTGGLRPGDEVEGLGYPLSAELGPWLIGGVFDGLLRPLASGATWLEPGAAASAPSDHTWNWKPTLHRGDAAEPGTIAGVVEASGAIEYRIVVPPGVRGGVESVTEAASLRADAELLRVGDVSISMSTRWPVRKPRPYRERNRCDQPLVTGQRVLDMLFPLERGGSAAVPGGFGTGKTLLLQQVAKWCDADVIVYVGCGERGNEMADVLADFAELDDPRTGGRLLDRTVIIANASNMPMMAREASVYSGITVAEYFRDMGHHAVVIADSTSRWAEALREFASRSGAMPAEEGYPADLSSSLAAFYERAGAVTTLGGASGSVTVIGAVSPPGGDMTEPVTTLTQRFVRGVWSLDHDLAYARHYPAVSWAGSFARDADNVGSWYSRAGDSDWTDRRARLSRLLAENDRLVAIADLMGAASLPDAERIALLAGRLVREGLLQQSALDQNDAYCTPAKSAALADAIVEVIAACDDVVAADVPISNVESFDFAPLLRAAREFPPAAAAAVAARGASVAAALRALRTREPRP